MSELRMAAWFGIDPACRLDHTDHLRYGEDNPHSKGCELRGAHVLAPGETLDETQKGDDPRGGPDCRVCAAKPGELHWRLETTPIPGGPVLTAGDIDDAVEILSLPPSLPPHRYFLGLDPDPKNEEAGFAALGYARGLLEGARSNGLAIRDEILDEVIAKLETAVKELV